MSVYVNETAVVDDGCVIGDGTKIWHFSHIMKGCNIGENCNIGQNVVISPDVVIGKGVKIQNNVSVYTGVVCEDDVFLGPSMVFTNVINPRSFVSRKSEYKQTILHKGCSIGANATIVCGQKDVKPYALMVGNPARRMGWVSENGHKLVFNADGIARCPETGQTYKLENDTVRRIS